MHNVRHSRVPRSLNEAEALGTFNAHAPATHPPAPAASAPARSARAAGKAPAASASPANHHGHNHPHPPAKPAAEGKAPAHALLITHQITQRSIYCVPQRTGPTTPSSPPTLPSTKRVHKMPKAEPQPAAGSSRARARAMATEIWKKKRDGTFMIGSAGSVGGAPSAAGSAATEASKMEARMKVRRSLGFNEDSLGINRAQALAGGAGASALSVAAGFAGGWGWFSPRLRAVAVAAGGWAAGPPVAAVGMGCLPAARELGAGWAGWAGARAGAGAGVAGGGGGLRTGCCNGADGGRGAGSAAY
ncbi:uncharacterized protein MKK02DRAFT_32968 [Dioszegia hungarica]|uniref:Uncharacterized protein n=1 Tax=Dioszegia hungarica TaxID=4972 RepID=A0AA38LVP3_9TREE|nr:uncharacterized protein MKK02DRAFT_32968 [Dioszegia hungarica]KAI9635581.1 hypothetical protein MKK02DRAFT_32968 [Dioszegia hungarica]